MCIRDRPTAGIDIGAKDEIYKILDNLAEQGVSIPVSYTHLDVYKRQGWGRVRGRALGAANLHLAFTQINSCTDKIQLKGRISR